MSYFKKNISSHNRPVVSISSHQDKHGTSNTSLDKSISRRNSDDFPNPSDQAARRQSSTTSNKSFLMVHKPAKNASSNKPPTASLLEQRIEDEKTYNCTHDKEDIKSEHLSKQTPSAASLFSGRSVGNVTIRAPESPEVTSLSTGYGVRRRASQESDTKSFMSRDKSTRLNATTPSIKLPSYRSISDYDIANSTSKSHDLSEPQHPQQQTSRWTQKLITLGSFLTYTVLQLYTWLLRPEVITKYIPRVDEPSASIVLPDNALHNCMKNVNESREVTILEFEGWMNLLEGQEYDPNNFHTSNTEVVFVKLEGVSLKLKKPLELDIPKRMFWNEPTHSVTYIKQIHVDMRDYVVELMPVELPQGKIYNKRFPICLMNKRKTDTTKNSKLNHERRESESLFSTERAPVLPSNRSSRSKSSHSRREESQTDKNIRGSPDCIILFARTSREKEEWHRRLDQASKGTPVTTMVLELKRLAALEAEDDASHSDDSSYRAENDSAYVRKGSKTNTLTNKKRKLLDRDQKTLLTEYMKYMMNVMQISRRIDPIQAEIVAKTSTKTHSNTNINKQSEKSLSPSRISGFLSGKTKQASSLSSGAQQHHPHKAASTHKTDQDPAYNISVTECDTGCSWVNALLHRIFFDFFNEQYWNYKIKNKIQKKLNKISLPYYLSQLTVGEINLGKGMPFVKKIAQPYLSDDGLWIDTHIAYNGTGSMTIETKINLNKLKREDDQQLNRSRRSSTGLYVEHRTADVDDDSDDSSTLSDDAGGLIGTPLDKDPKKGDHALTKIFNSLKDSKYFQKLADTKLIKSALDKVSNTSLRLSVEVKYLSGVFSMNIPPPPSDRVWFGFRYPPEIVISATPVVGEKSVNVAKLSKFIEEKLVQEFQRELVLPNMVDKRVKLMCGNYKTAANKKQRRLRTSHSTISERTKAS